MLGNLASGGAYCVVNVAGMCCTRKTAAGKSRVNPGARRITVAGPPVEAPRTTIGKRWSRGTVGCGREARRAAGTAVLALTAWTVDARRDAVRTTRTLADMRTLRSR